MKEKFEGLLYTPATDLNFISGIQRLKDDQLNAMLERLIELEGTEGGHKGHIKTVEKELKNRGGNSTELIAMEKMRNEVETVERLYGDGLPYDKDRLEDTAKFYLAQTAQSLFESGKIFLRLKAHEGHGGFMDSLTRIGIPQSTANYAMAVVLKFGPNSQALGNLGITKIQMLTVLDEPDIKALVKDGVTGNLTLDDIDRMTTRELREKLREEREKHKKDVETREKAIKQKEAKINEMDEQLRYQQPPTKEQLAIAELGRLDEGYFRELTTAMSAFRKLSGILNQAQCVPGVNVQILDEWIDKYNELMVLLNGVHEEFAGQLDNLHPIDRGQILDGAI